MSSPSLGPERRAPIAVIGCGALAVDLERTTRTLGQLRPHYAEIAIGYADCGTYGALDELCADQHLRRLPGDHCSDAYAGRERIAALMAEHPGTYLLTDFLIAGFDRLVWRELDLDRHPELLVDDFGNYEQVAWLAVHRTADLERAAARVAARLGLPLAIIDCGSEQSHFEGSVTAMLTLTSD